MKNNNCVLTKISFEPELYQITAIATLPGMGHCISGRGGGVSRNGCASLNISFNSGDDQANVEENRRRILMKLGLDPDRVFFQQQVHRDGIREVPEEWARPSPYSRMAAVAETDALFTTHPDVCLVGKAADCVLVGLFDPVCQAVAMVHAGWRSTVRGILAKTVQRMTERTGTAPENITAFFSPSAGPCCYEVGSELFEEARKTGWIRENHFRATANEKPGHKNSKFMLDLWAANTWQLVENGVHADNIYNPALCTICHHERFFSYRVLDRETGGHAMLIWLTGPEP